MSPPPRAAMHKQWAAPLTELSPVDLLMDDDLHGHDPKRRRLLPAVTRADSSRVRADSSRATPTCPLTADTTALSHVLTRIMDRLDVLDTSVRVLTDHLDNANHPSSAVAGPVLALTAAHPSSVVAAPALALTAHAAAHEDATHTHADRVTETVSPTRPDQPAVVPGLVDTAAPRDAATNVPASAVPVRAPLGGAVKTGDTAPPLARRVNEITARNPFFATRIVFRRTAGRGGARPKPVHTAGATPGADRSLSPAAMSVDADSSVAPLPSSETSRGSSAETTPSTPVGPTVL